MNSKRSFHSFWLITICFLLSIVCAAAFCIANAPSESAYADDAPVIQRSNTAVSSPAVCQYEGGETAFCSNTLETQMADGFYTKIYNESSFCSYTGASFNNGTGTTYSSGSSFDYCYTDGNNHLQLSGTEGAAQSAPATHAFSGSNIFVVDESGDYDTPSKLSDAGYAGTKVCQPTDASEQNLRYFLLQSSSIPSSVKLVATFSLSQQLKDALSDRLLIVKMTPYVATIVTTDNSVDIGDRTKDSLSMECFCYNKGTIQHSDKKPVNVPLTTGMEKGASKVLSSGEYVISGNDAAFIQVSVSDFDVNDACSTIITEIGIIITVTPNTGINFDASSTYKIIGQNRNKSEDEKTSFSSLNSYATVGDEINFDIKIKSNGRFIYLEESSIPLDDHNNPTDTLSGQFFHKLFTGAGDMTIEFFLPDTSSGDMSIVQASSGQNSGQNAVITVNGKNRDGLLIIRISIRYKELISGAVSPIATKDVTIRVDDRAPSAPILNTDSAFYNNYLDERGVYYTASNDDDKKMDGENVYALDIGGEDKLEEDKLTFDLDSLEVKRVGASYVRTKIDKAPGSDLTIYYKSSYYKDTYPSIQGDKSSEGIPDGFDVNDSEINSNGYRRYEQTQTAPSYYIGKYCTAIGNDEEVAVTYGSLLLDMTYLKDGDKAYRKKGVWYVELFVYDNVGNFSYALERVFIRVDITQYKFDIKYFLGSGDTLGTIETTDVELYYEKLSTSGNLSERVAIDEGSSGTTGSITLYRGDRVRFQISFSKETYAKYIFTGFQVGGSAKKDCTDLAYDSNYRSILGFATAERVKSNGTTETISYSFTVTDSLCKDKANRSVNLYFKGKISISATNLIQPYSGVIKKVTPYASYNSTQLSINISTVYFTMMSNVKGDYQVNAPIGEYVYRVKDRADSLPTSTASTGQKVFANLQMVRPTETTYQSGVTYYKMLLKEDNSATYPLHSGFYFCYCSVTSNANYHGYAIIVFYIRPGTPVLSTFYGLKESGQGQTVDINYGVSLAEIDTKEEDPTSTSVNASKVSSFNENFYTHFIVDKEGEVPIDTMTSFLSTDGILGYFEIDKNFLKPTSAEYVKPSAGLHEIPIMFVPIVWTGEKAYTYYERTRTLNPNTQKDAVENKYFIRNEDYEIWRGTVLIYVKPSTDVTFSLVSEQMPSSYIDTLNGVECVFYTYVEDTRQGISYKVVSNYENEDGTIRKGNGDTGKQLELTRGSTLISYAAIDSASQSLENVVFTEQVPMDAGLYAARVDILESSCNYSGQKIWYVQINKIDLDLEVPSSSYDYQHEEYPGIRITKSGMESSTYSALTRRYTFYAYDRTSGLSYAETCTANNLVTTPIRPYVYLPVNAGEYVVKVEIVDNNYSGTGYGLYTINQVTDNNMYIKKTWPAVSDSSVRTGCNICYGQPLSEVKIVTTNLTRILYEYQEYDSATRKNTMSRSVTGEFFIATTTYTDWLNGAKSTPEMRAQYIAQMKNYEPGVNRDTGYRYYICFAANEGAQAELGIDERANFGFLYTNVVIKVGYAYIDWQEVSIAPIEYENGMKSIAYKESVTESAPAPKDAIIVNKKIGSLFMQNVGENYEYDAEKYYKSEKNLYRYVGSDDYSLTLMDEEKGYYEAGSHNVTIVFVPAQEKTMYEREDHRCVLTVKKKELDIAIANDTIDTISVGRDEDQLKSVYNYYSAEDSYHYFAYSTVNGVSNVTYEEKYVMLTKKPDDWNDKYQNYYVISNGSYVKNTFEAWGEVDCYEKVEEPIFNGKFIYTELTEETDVVPGVYTLSSGGLQYVLTHKKEVNSRDVRSIWTVQVPVTDSRGNVLLDEIGLPRTEVKRIEIANSDVGKEYDVVEYVSVLPAGKYTVHFYINNNNYVGDISYTFTIEKAQLRANIQPTIVDIDTSLAYLKRASNLRFSGGEIVADKNGETVSGRYVIADSLSSTIFGNAGVKYDIEYKFIPDDIDNYEVLDESLGEMEVRKADISADLTLNVANYVFGQAHERNGKTYQALTAKDFFGYENRFDSQGSNSAGKLFDYTCNITSEYQSSVGSNYYVYITGASERQFINAGKYRVTLEIDENCQNYCGSVTTMLTVAKDRVYIVLEDDDDHDYVIHKAYDLSGSMQSVTPVLYNSIGEKVTSASIIQNYYQNGALVQTPSAIGKYNLRMNLNSTTNYTLVTAEYVSASGDDEAYWRLSDIESSYIMADIVVGVNQSEIAFTNIVQTYSETKTVIVDLGINSAYCSLEYVRVEDGVETGVRYKAKEDRFPTEAGSYNIHLIFSGEDNNGYEADIIWEEKLIINKFTAKITCPNTVEVAFTGKEYEVVSPFTDPYGLMLEYSYSASGAYTKVDRLSKLGELPVGDYSVQIDIKDNNYCGSKLITLKMKKASLIITEAPVFGGYYYNSSILPVPQEGKGAVLCTENNESDIKGKFSMNYDEISVLPVGVQMVNYTFTPDEEDEIAKNYAPVQGRMRLTISKAEYDMSYVSLTMNGVSNLLSERDHTVEYNGNKYEFTANITNKNSIYRYDSDNSDFYISLVHSFRDGSGNETPMSPRSIGVYTVTATVISGNYTGTKKWTYNLNIIKGVPEIVTLPTIGKTVYLGNSVNASDLIGGKAAVKGNHSKKIDGSFTMAEQTFTSANNNDITVTFVPSDIDLYVNHSFTISVNVIGNDLFRMATAETASSVTMPAEAGAGTTSIVGKDWTSTVIRAGYACSRLISIDLTYVSSISTSHEHGVYIAIFPKTGSYLTYGADLSSFDLQFMPCVANCAECESMKTEMGAIGVLEFVDKTIVPNVGDSVEVSFTLYQNAGIENQEKFNKMVGSIALGDILRKYILPSSTTTVELIGFIGKRLTEEDGHRLNIRLGGKDIKADPTQVEFSYTGVVTADKNDLSVNITTFVSQNYEFATLPTALLKVYNELSEEDIKINKLGKVYDGKALSPSDLMLEAINANNVQIPIEAFSLTVYDEENNLSQGINIGIYTVRILLRYDDAESAKKYYGESETTYTIGKQDVSDLMQLSKTYDVYGSDTYTTSPNVYVFPDADTLIPASQLNIKYRLAGSGQDFISTVSVAGTYEMRVIVTSDNRYGEHIFEYVIRQQELTFCTGQESYLYSYGEEHRSPTVEFSNGEAMDYVLYYQKEGYSKTSVVPDDAGEYTVTIELSDKNYTLRDNSFKYVIQAQLISIEKLPKLQQQENADHNVYHLKYGSKLIALNTKFRGGVVKTSGGDVVSGKFIVNTADENKVLDVGTKTVTMWFVPDSTNYQRVEFSMQVIIAEVEVVIEFKNLMTEYRGYSMEKALEYVISGVDEEIPLTFKFISLLQGTETTKPIAAGSYEVEATSGNPNYIVKTTTVYGGTSKPIFVINKAAVDHTKTIQPSAASISVGDSLMKSALNGGQVYYKNFTNAIKGSYTFVQTAKSFKNAGEETVQFRFIPIDNNNFDSYIGSVKITINKGTAVIHWQDVTVTYGTPADFSTLRSMFTTTPSNLFYRVSTYDVRNDKMYDDSGEEPLYMNANTYTFTCWVEDDNYVSDVYRFDYIVEKKKIDIDFINENGSVVTAYNVLYAKSVSYGFKLYDSNDTTGRSYYIARDAETVYANAQYHFTSRDEGLVYDDRVPPTELGSYNITVNLIHENYTATASAIYKIVKGTVEEINFDLNSLAGQIYGAVSPPIIVTVPTDVSYYIIYQGYDRVMPTDVGSYNITVYIDDVSYNSKQISAVFKINPKPLVVSSYIAQDKVYDGTTTVQVQGVLSGVLYSDEVSIVLKGVTADESADVGKHGVKITDYRLTGLKAENYTLTFTECGEIIEIKTSTVRDKNSASYITSTTGFLEGTDISFYEVDSNQNETSAATKAVGASATIVGYTITVNGEPTITDGQYKICVQIPEEYKSTDFVVDFGGQDVLDPHREGDMYVFNTSVSSGQIVFSKASFKYTYLIIIIAVAIVAVGVILLLVLNPMKKK